MTERSLSAAPRSGASPRPYADAPRLPGSVAGRPGQPDDAFAGEPVDVRALVAAAEWIEIEIGPGRGVFVMERVAAAPGAGVVGLEVRRKWATIVDARLAKLGLSTRARVFAEDAKHALPRLGPAASVRRFFVHFPDPWWKKRHQKRLVMGDLLLGEMARLLEPGGEIFVQTDVEERAAEYETMLAKDARFAPHGDATGSARLADNPYGARSPREKRAVADGLPVHRLRFKKLA